MVLSESNFLLCLISISIASVFFFLLKKTSRSYKLPPGPSGLPIVGNMFDLGDLPHIKMEGMRNQYGPVMWLKIGAINTLVIQSAQAATAFFKNHDANFLERVVVEVNRVCNYLQGSLALAPYGNYWRMLRRICSMELFVHSRINNSESIRRKSVDKMIQWIETHGKKEQGQGIEITRFVFLASFNMLGNLIMSKELAADPDSTTASEFFDAMMGQVEWSGTPNISDVFPLLRWLDIQGLRRKMKRDMGKGKEILSTFIKERIKEQENGRAKGTDFLDVLLAFEGKGKDEPAKLSEHEINIFILEMFLAGTETSSSTTEWALTELLRNPETMARVKAEIAEVVGPNKKFEESDIDKVPYMQAVVKETFRLHPPLPFLLPRKATQDTKFMGYDVPKGTQIFINAWAIGRDPECWHDPLDFIPERFIGSKIDFKGLNYELIPFGAGRRMCVGVPLGHRMVHFVLGTLLHEFNWELPHNMSSKSIDMTERLGTTVRKLEPLKVIPNKCKLS
uniref:Cytochrome P450 n=1 Tax=Petunia hybrida TaxID=4102 RepID=Q8H0I8_PETHY|nr:cytochrome P450 [Petunia x hybrida]